MSPQETELGLPVSVRRSPAEVGIDKWPAAGTGASVAAVPAAVC